MQLSGSTDGISFADILNTLCRVNQEGVLTVTDEKRRKSIYFQNNGVTLIGGTQRMRLGDMLLHAGKISPRELDRVLAEQKKSGKIFGEIVAEQGLASTDEIEELIANQLEDEICDLFFWENAQFSFQEGPLQSNLAANEQNHVILTFDVRRLLFRIADKLGEWEEVRRQIPSFAIIFVPARATIDLDLAGKNQNSQSIERVLRLLDGMNDVTDVIRQSQFSVLTVCRILILLLEQNAIRSATYEELMQIAQDLGKKSKTPKQIHVLEQALLLRPGDEELLLKIAHAYENTGGSKKTAEYYCKLGDRYFTNDPKTSLKYFERAIAHSPNIFEPREKILLLCEVLNDTIKEQLHSEMLCRAYVQEKAWEKAQTFCVKYIERYPNKIEFQETLAEAYRQLGKKQQAIQIYEELIEIYTHNNDIRLLLETLRKVLELDSKRSDIHHKISRLQSYLRWGKWRVLIITGSLAGVFIVGFAILILYYEFAARNLYEQAQKLESIDKVTAKETYLLVATKYNWSTVAEESEQQAKNIENLLAVVNKEEQVRQQERDRMRVKELEHIQNLISVEKYQEARNLIAGYRSEYREPQWQKKFNELEAKIQQREQRKYSEDIQLQVKQAKEYQKKQQWDQAIEIYQKLVNTELKEIAEDGIKETKKQQLEYLEKFADENIQQATTDERACNFNSAEKNYEQALQMVSRALDIKMSNNEQMQNLFHIRTLATRGKERIESLTSQANQKLKQAQNLEQQGKIPEAFYLILDVLQDPKLGKTEIASKATLPIQINTEPRGALVKELNVKTPVVIHIEPQKTKKFEIVHPSFESSIIEIGKKNIPIIEVNLQKKTLWTYNTGGPIWGKVSSQDNRVVVTSRSGNIVALNTKDGKLLWENKTQGLGGVKGGSVIFDNQVYIGSNDRCMRAFNLETGQLIWEFISDDFIEITPIVDQDYVLFGTSSGTFYCLQRVGGKLIWSYKQPNTKFIIAPAIWSNLVITGNNRGELSALQLTDGQVAWKHKLDDMICTDLIVGDKSLYFGTALGMIYCWDIEQNQIVWKNKLAGRIGSHVTIVQRFIYVGTTNGYFYCLSRQDGRELWKYKIDNPIYSAPSPLDDMICVATMDNDFFIFDQEGNIFWKTSIGSKGIRSDLMITDHAIYISTEEGIIYALAR